MGFTNVSNFFLTYIPTVSLHTSTLNHVQQLEPDLLLSYANDREIGFHKLIILCFVTSNAYYWRNLLYLIQINGRDTAHHTEDMKFISYDLIYNAPY